MSSKNINLHQFRMFIPAHELMSFIPADGVPRVEPIEYGKDEVLLEQKREENTVPIREGTKPLIESVAKEGVHDPVHISDKKENDPGIIWNGHHRIVAAYDTNPNMEVPVRYM